MTTLLSCSRGHPNPSSHRFCERCGEQLERAIRPGKVVCDRYRVVEALGQGGFGQTYLVEDSNRFNERCVLKVFAPSVDSPAALEKAKELFNREAEVLYRLEHPQIPRFREWFTELPALYLVQDYVEGQTYQMLLKQRQQPFSESEVASFLRQALPVLDYIHGRGMVHRDISPDNLMRRTCDRKPVLIDFGGVKEITASLGRFGAEAPSGGLTLIGKPGYAPEEQIRLGRVSPASDIYALGVTALVLLVGQEPQDFFDANTCTFKWQPFVNLSPGFAAVLEKMVASHAVKRYRAAAQVLKDLEPLEIADVGNDSRGTLPPDAPNTMPPATAVENPYLTQQTVIAQVQSPGPVAKIGNSLRNGLVKLLQAVVIVAIMITVGALAFGAVYSWLQQSPATSEPTESPEPAPTPPQGFSADEQSRKRELFKRLRATNTGLTYFNQVTNEAFYLEYPRYPRRPLTKGAADAKLRAEWDQVGTEVVDALEAISPSSRQRIGRYGPSTRKGWDVQLRKARVNQAKFYRDVDRQFQQQLTMYRGTELEGKRGEQIWFAIANDRLQQELKER
ncbi:Serine/threonine-protein kinase B [Acaryochloris thomasi RCC1774]|uniref:non-specific serine/threonine protein kinase n=1 Tax=Acaryochloris thomasi RCC1774 TaxID=1764569 RepID=A0A2W1JLC4_9CYAN|nr:protein kinase [Acaryochloris thomasi]PZD72245.1 Serine/threonine-protein kinase B [Acaryochloris thomasi RCC1774]